MQTSCFLSGAYGFLLGGLLAQPVAAQSTRLDPAFQLPVILNAATAGTVNDVVRQPDGKYVIGGAFTSINGVRARNLARLNADGTLDAAFTAHSQANQAVTTLALQPDGSILVGGIFDSLATARRQALGRILPSGLLDAVFNANLTLGSVSQVGVLPGGDVLILSPGSPSASPPVGLYRLNGSTGQADATFQAAVNALCFAVKSDGRIVTGGGGTSYVLMHLLAQLLPSGALDPSFSPYTSYYYGRTERVEVDATNVIYRLGAVGSSVGGGLSTSNQRTFPLADGAYTFKMQPNNRVILGILKSVNGTGNANATLTDRLLPDGALDASYISLNGPRADANGQGAVRTVVVQPDGAMLMAGTFTRAGTTPVHGLIRLLDANVLATSNPAAATVTQAWPVPTRDVLNVALEPASGAQVVQLLDVVGRIVLTHPVSSAAAPLALDVTTLPVGTYLLRVSGGQGGPVVRRIEVRR